MSVNPINNQAAVSGKGAVTTDGVPYNLIGLLDSDPDVREAAKGVAGARDALAHIGADIVSGNYSQATADIAAFQNKYGPTLYQHMESVLVNALPPAVLHQIGFAPPAAPQLTQESIHKNANGEVDVSLSWSEPNTAGITSYTLTPTINGVLHPELAVTVTGNPPATNATITLPLLPLGGVVSLALSATNAFGTSPPTTITVTIFPPPPSG